MNHLPRRVLILEIRVLVQGRHGFGLHSGALARTLQAHAPDLHVICTSGYTPEYIERDLPSNDKITFLPKPYLPNRLLEVVRQCLAVDRVTANGKATPVTECTAPV